MAKKVVPIRKTVRPVTKKVARVSAPLPSRNPTATGKVVPSAVPPSFTTPEPGFMFICQCGFSTRQWATKELAAKRGAEHTNEHQTGEPMSPMGVFVLEVGGNK